MLVHTISGVPRAPSDMRKEGRLIHERKKPMMKIIAAAAFVVAPWTPATLRPLSVRSRRSFGATGVRKTPKTTS